MCIRFLPSCYAVSVLALAAGVGCTSAPENVARQPNVATRYATLENARAPAPPSSSAPPANDAAPLTDAAHAFDPPAELRLPSTLQPNDQVPLLLVLHGFGVSSGLLIAKAGLNRVADEKKFAYLAPEGLRDALGRPYWNAGKSCCDLDHRGVDDTRRLHALLEANSSNRAIDPKRVFVIGFSNGAFMAQRLACEVGDRIAGVISVAGAAPSADTPCTQSTSLSFLEIHGDADPIVHYGGGTVFDRTDVAAHPSALDTARYWAQRLSCTGEPRDVQSIDIEPYLADRETKVQRFDGCRGTVELWTVTGGGHYVALQPPALEAMWSFVVNHPKAD
ncbi:MAG: PHB depolymerase family esterase [Pseudomonadota bacterium]